MGLSGFQENEENVLESVRALLPELRAAAARTDALRHVPEESVAALKKTGAFRLMQPARFGGLELGLDSLLRASAEVGRACGSTSWCVAVLAIHNWFLGLFPEEAQKEVWGADPDAVLASVFASMGRARPEEGGFRLEGRWQFASGSDHGDWITVGAVVDHGTKLPLPDVRSFLVPRKDFRIEDTWHVAGLRGTGSKDVVIENAHVPSHRILNFAEAHCGKSPGSRINTSPLYRMPFASVLTMTLACPALGVARGMLENFCERAAARTVLFGGAKQSEQSHSHIAISEAAAEVDAAELLLLRDIAEMRAFAEASAPVPLECRARYKRDSAYAVTLCARAGHRLFSKSGGNALYDSNPLQRGFRDLHAMEVHALLNFDNSGEQYGRIRLGLPPTNPVI